MIHVYEVTITGFHNFERKAASSFEAAHPQEIKLESKIFSTLEAAAAWLRWYFNSPKSVVFGEKEFAEWFADVSNHCGGTLGTTIYISPWGFPEELENIQLANPAEFSYFDALQVYVDQREIITKAHVESEIWNAQHPQKP